MPAVASINSTERSIAWCLVMLGLTPAVAWMFFQLQSEGFAPAVLFPLLAGATLGCGAAAAQRACGRPGPWAAAVVTAVAGLLVVIGQDYIGYRRLVGRQSEIVAQNAPAIAASLAPGQAIEPTFSEYLARRVASRPAWWIVEAVLTVLAAAGVVIRFAGKLVMRS